MMRLSHETTYLTAKNHEGRCQNQIRPQSWNVVYNILERRETNTTMDKSKTVKSHSQKYYQGPECARCGKRSKVHVTRKCAHCGEPMEDDYKNENNWIYRKL